MKKLSWFLVLLASCSPGNRPEMLGNTNLIAVQGSIPQELQAPENGRIWVYDSTVKKRLFALEISGGQNFKIDPIAQSATVDAKLATTKVLPLNHELIVLFTRN